MKEKKNELNYIYKNNINNQKNLPSNHMFMEEIFISKSKHSFFDNRL